MLLNQNFPTVSGTKVSRPGVCFIFNPRMLTPLNETPRTITGPTGLGLGGLGESRVLPKEPARSPKLRTQQCPNHELRPAPRLRVSLGIFLAWVEFGVTLPVYRSFGTMGSAGSSISEALYSWLQVRLTYGCTA